MPNLDEVMKEMPNQIPKWSETIIGIARRT